MNGSKRILQKRNRARGFSLIEVIIAAAILSGGLLAIVRVFPYGVEVSRRSEDLTQATLLAKQMFEGIKMDHLNYPILPGAESVVIPIPGNAYDDDTNNETFNQLRGTRANSFDLNHNAKPDIDFDGMPEADGLGYNNQRGNGIDDDGDGVIDDNGDSWSQANGFPRAMQRYSDGDYYYDPEPNIDEEFPNGLDDDRDGLIDEDIRLASVRILGSQIMIPVLAGDGMDNDGDGEAVPGQSGQIVADGIDNDGDGMIDEGIDEEIWNGIDDDGDGMIDEDCRLSAFPFSPGRLPAPYDKFGWQIRVGRIPDNGRFGIADINGDGTFDLGDGIDNDGDGLVDEELVDGHDYDFPIPVNHGRGTNFMKGYTRSPSSDGLIDEDTVSPVLPDWRRLEILITWGGDGEDNDGDLTRVDPKSKSPLGLDDPTVIRKQRVSYGSVSWGIDEEKEDGLDNDLDGKIDEDTYKHDYLLVGFINMRNPSESFMLISGQPRGLESQMVNR